jgi:hypothetical protein
VFVHREQLTTRRAHMAHRPKLRFIDIVHFAHILLAQRGALPAAWG